MDVDNTAMTALKVVGWWVTSLAEVDLPAPQELVGDLSPSIRAALIKHLTSGLRLVHQPVLPYDAPGTGDLGVKIDLQHDALPQG
jgi:hypothetical protein